MTCKDGLCHLAKKFDIGNAGNMKKGEVIDALRKAHKMRDLHKAAEPAGNAGSRKTRHCPFRLLNVLFSNKFSDEFGRLGDVATANQLTDDDTKNKVFWTRVEEAFHNPDNGHGVLHFVDDEVLQGDADIDPPEIQQHDWEKLSKICHNVQKQWKEAAGRQTRSGMQFRVS